jgi:TfoX/Sxy family transcriptional regulator of competence genes
MAKHVDPQIRWLPSPEPLNAAFRAAVDPLPGVTRRMMFGYPTAAVNGNMFACLLEDRMALRLESDDREALLQHEGAAPFEPIDGRPWREYVVAPPQVVGDPGALAGWVWRAYDYAVTLPPKKKRA